MPVPTGYAPVSPDVATTPDVKPPAGYTPIVAEDNTPRDSQDGFLVGAGKAVAKSGKDILEGVGSGIMSTGQGIYNLVRKGTKAVGLGDLPSAPDFVQKAAANTQYDSQGNPVAPSGSFSTGRIGEQISEFLAPSGAVTDLASAAGKFGKAAEIGARVAGDAAGATAVTAAQTGGDTTKMAESAITAGVASGAFSTIGGILSSIPTNSVYLKGLSFPKRFLGEQVDEAVSRAINEGILISKGGANKAAAWKDAAKDAVDAEISRYGNVPVDQTIVAAPIQRLSDMARRLGKDSLADRIDGQLEDFLKARGAKPAVPAVPPQQVPTGVLDASGNPVMRTIPGTPAQPAVPAKLTVADAQDAKKEFYAFANKAFGTDGTSEAQIDKLIGRGLMKSMEAVSPEIQVLNRNAQNAILIENAIDKYVKSTHDVISPRMMLLLMFNRPEALLYGAWTTPFVRSALAIAKDRVAKSVVVPAFQAVPRTLGAIPSVAGDQSQSQGPQ